MRPPSSGDLPRFLECENPETGRVFVLHTQAPRVLAEVSEDGASLAWVRDWGDSPGPDAAKLMREMGDWYAQGLDQ